MDSNTDLLLELGSRLSQLSSSDAVVFDDSEYDDRDPLWQDLVEAGRHHAAACAEADDALPARDRLILEASEAGISRREVARAAGVSPGGYSATPTGRDRHRRRSRRIAKQHLADRRPAAVVQTVDRPL